MHEVRPALYAKLREDYEQYRMLNSKKALTNYGVQITGSFSEALSKGNNIYGNLE
jgi:hypothetical protein